MADSWRNPESGEEIKDVRGTSSPSWSLQIGTVAGIPIRVHFTFLFLLVLVAWLAHSSGQSVTTQVGVVVGLFACIVLHELGHALTARAFGIRTRDITLYPIGGISSLQSMGKPWQELWISLAGPAVNVAIAIVLGVLLRLTGHSLLTEVAGKDGPSFLYWLFVGNLFLALFNVIPAFPMDGGRILRSALALRIGADRATRVAAAVGQGLAVVMALYALWNPAYIMLLFVALFVFFGAGGEAEMQRTLATTSGYHMRDAMITQFETISHGDTLGAVAERLLRTNQEDFPVAHGERVLGLLTRRQLLSSLVSDGRDAIVASVMSREFPRVAPGDDLSRALELLRGRGAEPLLVFDGERLAGMVTLANLLEFLSVARAGAVPAAPPA